MAALPDQPQARSCPAGPPQTLTEAEVRHVAEPLEETIRLLTPELDDLARVLRDAGYCVNLADANATMLFSRLPGEADARMFMDWKIYTGSNFAETFEGTNGLGTCLAEQKPILVHRDEHFRAQWHMFSCAVAPLFDQAGRLAGAVNITSCREDLERAAHQLALAVTMEATRRMEGAIFRDHFRNAWIATVPGDGGSGLLAYDDDRRIVGACRSARALLGLTDGLIASGIDLSRYIKLDHARNADEIVELRRADGRPLGQSHVAPPLRAKSTMLRRDAPVDRFDALHRLAGGDPGLVKSVKRLRSIGDHNLPVLLHGETGVGKDVFARAIHAASNRARNNYVALNCAAMPESLIDAELFGYEAGAFTGARRDDSKGLIVQADGGTLFLDEIGDMPIALQTRLLRVLENREVWPLGALKPVPVDIRLISATHRDLGRMAEEGLSVPTSIFACAAWRYGCRRCASALIGMTSSARSRARRRRTAASRAKPGRCSRPIPTPATCASSATCSGLPAVRRRMASSWMPTSICRRSAGERRGLISKRPSEPPSSRRSASTVAASPKLPAR